MDDPSVLQRRAYDTFERLLDADDAALVEELAALQRSDAGLYARVSMLLEADRRARAAAFLDVPAVAQVGFDAADSSGAERAGTTIGPYRLVRPIGRGGMGEVWLARRDDRPQGAPVALKLLHLHLVASTVRSRFAREGRILGELTHDHVARFLDAGSDPAGRPYLVIEYVEGERLDLWCDKRSEGIEGRLRLFLQVCDAVAHAHAHLIVHRDLKPSNILVTAEGSVKLLDFGIAKLVDDSSDGVAVTELTRLGGNALTPEYAAPEQIAEGPITTATDVYALGVVLYRLLTGRRPYGAPEASAAQIERAVLHDQPTLPSTARAPKNGDRDDNGEALASSRSCTARGLRQALRGDLDTIVMKALKKEPRERYASVIALADDVRRHLDGMPVLARPDSLAYRAGKFVRRHRLGVAAGSAVGIAVLAGILGVVWQARRAEQQSLRAERVKDFVVSLFVEQDPMRRANAESRSPRQLIGAAVERLDRELKDDAQLHAELLGNLGEIAADLGDSEGGEKLLRRALAENEARYGAQSLEVAQSLRRLGRVSEFLGRHDETQKLDRRALDLFEAQGAGDTLGAAHTRRQLALHLSQGRGAPADALAMIDQAIEVFERRLGRDHIDTARAVLARAQMLGQDRRDAEAEPLLRDAIGRFARGSGRGTVFQADALMDLGTLLERAARNAEAEAAIREAIAIQRDQLGAKSRSLGRTLGNLAGFYTNIGRLDDAEHAYDEAIAALPGDAFAERSEVLRHRGRLRLAQQRPAEAERDMHEAYDLRRRQMGTDNAFTWYYASQWGNALAASGRVGQAEAVQREALGHVTELLGATAYQNSLIEDDLAETLQRKGDAIAEIIDLRRRALTLTEARYPPGQALWVTRALALAEALAVRGDEASAREAEALLGPVIDNDAQRDADARNKGLFLRARLRAARGELADSEGGPPRR